MMREPLTIPVSLGGLIAGRELGGTGMLHFDGVVIRIDLESGGPAIAGSTPTPAWLRRPQAKLRWPVSYLDGVRHRGDELTLFLRNGDIIELTGPARLLLVAEAVEADARALGELTRGLRSLGARRRGTLAGGEQARFFAPLMQARRAVERRGQRGADDQLVAFDGGTLHDAMASTITSLAQERYPDSPPDRRALEAELEECAEPLLDGMSSLSNAADGVRQASDDSRLVHWRTWSGEVRALFERADRCWCAMAPVLDQAPPPPQRSWWRRFRLGGGHRRTGR